MSQPVQQVTIEIPAAVNAQTLTVRDSASRLVPHRVVTVGGVAHGGSTGSGGPVKVGPVQSIGAFEPPISIGALMRKLAAAVGQDGAGMERLIASMEDRADELPDIRIFRDDSRAQPEYVLRVTTHPSR